MPRSRNSARAVLWIVLLVPLALQSYRYQTGAVFYGEYLHWTGDWATWLLLLVLALSPLRRLAPAAGWSGWLLRQRRDLGLACFLYGLAHALAYLSYKADLQLIYADSLSPGMLTGWLGLLLLLALALTSNNAAVRWLQGRWKTLHRLVYAAALLAVAHWALTAFDPALAYVHFVILALLLLARARLPGRTST